MLICYPHLLALDGFSWLGVFTTALFLEGAGACRPGGKRTGCASRGAGSGARRSLGRLRRCHVGRKEGAVPGPSPDIRSVGTRTCLVVKGCGRTQGLNSFRNPPARLRPASGATGPMPASSASSGRVEGAIRAYMWGTWGQVSRSGLRPRPKPDGELSYWGWGCGLGAGRPSPLDGGSEGLPCCWVSW